MSDVVIPGPLATICDLADARVAIAQHVGEFGSGNTPAELKRVLEWFVDDGCVMALDPADGGKLNDTHGCYCDGTALQFHGALIDPAASELHGWVKWDLHLYGAAPFAHLELFHKNPHEQQSRMKRHLRRAYDCLAHVGVTRITLEAGLSSGPTYWAHAGADFAGGRRLLSHLEVLAATLAGCDLADIGTLGSPGDVLRLSRPERASITEAYLGSELLSSLDPSGQVWVQPREQLVYKRDELGLDIALPRPIGEAILFAIGPWNGVFDLSQPGSTDARLREFLGVR